MYIQTYYNMGGGMRWDPKKNERLKRARGISFEELVRSELVCILAHAKRDNQKILLFRYQEYIWVAPCVICGEDVFLKTLFPSRKYTKMFERGELS